MTIRSDLWTRAVQDTAAETTTIVQKMYDKLCALYPGPSCRVTFTPEQLESARHTMRTWWASSLPRECPGSPLVAGIKYLKGFYPNVGLIELKSVVDETKPVDWINRRSFTYNESNRARQFATQWWDDNSYYGAEAERDACVVYLRKLFPDVHGSELYDVAEATR